MADASSAARLVAVDFIDLPGWADDDHAAAAAFRRSAIRLAAKLPTTKELGPDGAALARKGQAAIALGESLDDVEARAFFGRRTSGLSASSQTRGKGS